VRSTGIVSSEHCPSRKIPEFGYFPDDLREVFGADESRHVFEQQESGADDSDDFSCGWPLVPWIGLTESLAAGREWLAGEACRNDISHASVSFREAAKNKFADVSTIDGCIFENAILDSLLEDTTAILVPFDVSNGFPSKQHGAKDSAACSCEE
jgi:hypothetical protein